MKIGRLHITKNVPWSGAPAPRWQFYKMDKVRLAWVGPLQFMITPKKGGK